MTPAFRQFVLDQLEDLGDVTARWMFGGVGLYQRGVFFGIVAGDVLYLKVDDSTRPEYERHGMLPFNPYPKRSGTMKYYAVPVGVLESASELATWARKAVRVARGATDQRAGKGTVSGARDRDGSVSRADRSATERNAPGAQRASSAARRSGTG